MINCQRMLNCLRHCNLIDLEASGPKFTFSNNRDIQHYTRVKLDRAIANDFFLEAFKHIQVTTLPRTSSDHHPVCIKFSPNTPDVACQPENAWLSHEKFLDCVK